MIVIYCYLERENYKVSKYHANNSPYFEMSAAPLIFKQESGFLRFYLNRISFLTLAYMIQHIKLSISTFTSLRKKCPYSELFRSAFSRIRTEYGPD